MTTDPDYLKWVSVETISPHEFACLFLGVEPTAEPDEITAGSPPSMPDDRGDHLEPSDWEREYARVYGVLARAVSEKALPASVGGRFKLGDGLEYLTRVAEARGWSDHLSAAPFIRHASALTVDVVSREESLLERVRQLEEELAKCKTRNGYSTPMLDLVNAVIDEFYSSGGTDYPKQPVLDDFVREQAARLGSKLSNTQIHSVWAVASHPSQHSGGRKPLKRSGSPKGKTGR